VRNARLAGVPAAGEVRAAAAPGMFVAAVPVGLALAARDRRRDRG
jgi:hypothetical protein